MTTETQSIQSLAKEALSYFEQKQRHNEDKTVFWGYKDDAPKWLIQMVRNIHEKHFFECLPNDWIYGEIIESLDYLSREEDLYNLNLEPDCYTFQLLRWVSENSYAIGFCDEAIKDYNGKLFMELIGYAQIEAKQCIYDFVFQELESRME